MDLLREGASSRPEREAQRRAAAWVWDFMARGLGPDGSRKVVDGELSRAASALRALPADPGMAPYQRLATAVSGDQAATSVLLAAGTVREVLKGKALAQQIDGVALARRQVLAWMEAHAVGSDPERALAGVDAELAPLARHLESLDLDCIDVRPGPVPAAQWSDGLFLPDPGMQAARVAGPVLLVDALMPKARQAASLRIRDPGSLDAVHGIRAQERDRVRAALRAAGVRIVLCRQDPGEELVQELARDGVFVAGHVERSMAQRAALATGCSGTADAVSFSQGDLGRGEVQRVQRLRRVQWRLHGPGRTATIEVPEGPMQHHRVEAVEKWLRSVAPILQDPRVLPGGGAWQRQAAAAVRGVADHAPGAAPLGMQAVARTLDGIADALVRNMGGDPLVQRTLAPVDDAMACARPAVAGALETAIQLLRIDARHARRASRPADLRGGTGPAGSPRGMPGDIPPLM